MRSRSTVVMIFGVLFVISLITNVLGTFIPALIDDFHLDLTLAGFLPFSFFAAYGVMSIPAGLVIEKHGEKPVMLGAFALALAGTLAMVALPAYQTVLASLFCIGLGMAALQVAVNPLLRVAGGAEHYAFNAVMAQLVFGLGSFLSPRLHVALEGWLPLYRFFSATILVMFVWIAWLPLPRVEHESTSSHAYRELLPRPVVWAYFVAILAYVGLEQGLANWMAEFLAREHGQSAAVGATAVSNYWGLMTVGCVLGGFLLKFFDSRHVLIGFSLLAIVTLSAALFTSAAVWAFPACGFALSVMWSIIFALALNSLEDHHGPFAGLLCTGIVGGALVPLLVGRLGQSFGLRCGLCSLFVPLAYILSLGFWARPLINNK